MEIAERFNKFDDVFLGFEGIKNKRSNRKDLHAFILLDEIFHGSNDMIASAEHDEIWLGVDDDLDTLTNDQIEELVRCGVRYDSDNDSLCMFV
jgi:uncharacterized radical SAM superfamily Fe-S cluster-containing enzyme